MIRIRSSIVALFTALTIVSNVSSAAKTSITAKLDSTTLLMGNMSMLHLQVVQDKGSRNEFPILSKQSQNGIVGLCGDSIELRTNIKSDTIDLGSNRIQINYAIPIQSFDSGFYHLPEFVVVNNGDTAVSNRISLKVIPVIVGDNADISDYAGIVKPSGKHYFDWIPDSIIKLWWLWLLILAIIGLTLWGVKRYRNKGSILPKKPEPTPYESAISALKSLKASKIWEQGLEKEYFTQLTDILRTYLEKRFNINAMEMTSRQIMQTLTDNTEVKDKRDYIRKILDTADFVKFAKVRPLPSDNVAAMDNAISFVEETKPIVEDKESMKTEEIEEINDEELTERKEVNK
jgi:hypothetical protein